MLSSPAARIPVENSLQITAMFDQALKQLHADIFEGNMAAVQTGAQQLYEQTTNLSKQITELQRQIAEVKQFDETTTNEMKRVIYDITQQQKALGAVYQPLSEAPRQPLVPVETAQTQPSTSVSVSAPQPPGQTTSEFSQNTITEITQRLQQTLTPQWLRTQTNTCLHPPSEGEKLLDDCKNADDVANTLTSLPLNYVLLLPDGRDAVVQKTE